MKKRPGVRGSDPRALAASRLEPGRLLAGIRKAIAALALDLTGAVVLTEAASGPYVVTPVIAALAGAERVCAVTRDSRYATVAQVSEETMALARAGGCAGRIEIATEKTPESVSRADIVTNSGHLRPLDRQTVSWLKPGAVLPLMYEAWELRPQDVDVVACRERGVPLAGTNEEHPAVGVFNYLGIMVLKQLLECRVEVWGSRVLVLSDNRFAPYIAGTLRSCGASVLVDGRADAAAWAAEAPFDAVVVAMTPRPEDIVGGEGALLEAGALRKACPWGPVVQCWGDVERAALAAAGMPYHPRQAPARGHMGGLLSELGPQPVIRLQAGGLKVGEIMWRALAAGRGPREAVEAACRAGYGQPL